MVGYVVFGLFCAAMVVLAGFVIAFSVRIGRQRRVTETERAASDDTAATALAHHPDRSRQDDDDPDDRRPEAEDEPEGD